MAPARSSMSTNKDVLDQLDDTVNAIESHRDWRAKQRADEEAQLNQAWQEVLDAARALRSKLKDNAKLRYFSIARDEAQVAVSFRRSGGGSHLLSLYRHHPENKFPTTTAIWCREAGRLDERCHTSADAVQKLVQHCALNITDSKQK